MKVEYVPTTFVHQVWPDVCKFLDSALEEANALDEITTDQLRADLAQNRAALYKVTDSNKTVGAIAVTFQNQRCARVAFVIAIGGRWIAKKEAFEQFVLLLKQAGATKIAGAGRDSIVRLWRRFGLQKKHTIFEATL